MRIKQFFHYVSYLQYPLVIVACYLSIKPVLNNEEFAISDFSTVLMLMGISISFSTLQDTTKTQNNVSKRIWQSARKGKLTIAVFSLFAGFMIVNGFWGYVTAGTSEFKELYAGLMVLGISFIGLLKAAIEMFENHRLDKNPVVESQ